MVAAKAKRRFEFSIVDILVGMAILMILTAMVMPHFAPQSALHKSSPPVATRPAR